MLLGEEAGNLLQYTSTTIPKEPLHIPGPDLIDPLLLQATRFIPVFRSLATLFNNRHLENLIVTTCQAFSRCAFTSKYGWCCSKLEIKNDELKIIRILIKYA